MPIDQRACGDQRMTEAADIDAASSLHAVTRRLPGHALRNPAQGGFRAARRRVSDVPARSLTFAAADGITS
jgi:hypothetical protein